MPRPPRKKREYKPLEVDHCCCSECGGACPDPPAPFLARCEPCHYGDRHGLGTADEFLHWYCAAAGHGEDKCETREQHRLKLAGQYLAINEMLRGLDHTMEVAQDAKWGQMTLAEES